ncbi:MAG: helix-turn-helix domain-containing protein [Clostridiales bacterium]|nr:helix-turn-helix domain-containing protein [Clostridiales bacterium]
MNLKKLEQILEEMKEISHRSFLLFAPNGDFIIGTDTAPDCADMVKNFVFSLADTQMMPDWIYFRVELHDETEYVMLVSRGSDTDQSYLVGRMALCHVRSFFISMEEPENQVNGLRLIINGEITGERIGEKTHQLRLLPGKYLLFVIQYKENRDSILVEALKSFFVSGSGDYVVEMDGRRTVLLKEFDEIPDEDYRAFANVIVDNMATEVMARVCVGYGGPIESFDELNKAYMNACTALKVGTVFYSEESVFDYQKLGIGRLIYKLPADLCEMFLDEILGENKEIDLDDETMTTIRKLFDNNLNISETARQLYIHRNTLVYRLERIEKRLGLDIRTFEDAMLFKIAMMVRVHLNELNLEN